MMETIINTTIIFIIQLNMTHKTVSIEQNYANFLIKSSSPA